MKQVETVPGIGRRLIDVLDIHWYPEERLYVDKDNDGIQDRTQDLNGDGVITAGEDLDGDGDLATEPNYFCDLNGNLEPNGAADLDGDGVYEVKDEPEYRVHDDPSKIPTDCPDAATRLTPEQHASMLLQQEQKRLHAPRSLWDPSYNEDSWITQKTLPTGDKPIRLLPRLKALVAAHYPGTKLAVTEYYYGGRKDITGAIAQADALGIFGREGVFAATLWEGGLLRKLDPADPGYDPGAYEYIDAAFDMYRNFNGSNSSSGQFGPNSVPASTSNSVSSAIYASNGASERIVAVALNRDANDKVATLKIRSCSCYPSYAIYRLSQGTPHPQAANGLILEAKMNALRFTLPARSVVTIVANRKTPGIGNMFGTSSCRDR